MFEFLYQMSDIHLFFLLSGVMILFSIFMILTLKYVFLFQARYKDNLVIGNIGSIVGIIYGVLAGLMALYLINNINYATDAVQREASAAANVYRESQWLQTSARGKIQVELEKYIERVLSVEWPLMRDGKTVDQTGDQIITHMLEVLIQNSASSSPTEQLLQKDILTESKVMYDARQQRLLMNTLSLNIDVWIVILVGTALTIAINYLYKTKFSLHIVILSAAALIAASMIFLLITLDRPFQGDFSVEPTAFQTLLNLMKAHPSQ